MKITFGLIAQDSSSRATLEAVFGLQCNNAAVAFKIAGGLTVNARITHRASAQLASSGGLFASPDAFCYGHSVIPSIAAFGGESSALDGYGTGYAFLPALRSYGEGGFYVPPTPVYGYANLRPLFSTGKMTTSVGADGASLIPAVRAKGGENGYGEGSATLPAIRAFGAEGPPKHTVYCISRAFIISAAGNFMDHIVVFDSSGQFVDTITCTRLAISEILGSMTISGDFTLLGNFLLSMSENLSVTSDVHGHSTAVGVDDTSRVWVVNMTTSAPSQYDNYGYNSFLEADGVYYGLGDDGIYELDGDNDEGTDINAFIVTGKKDLGSPQKKGVVNVYVGVGSGDQVLLKVEADGQSYVYAARSNSTDIQNHRVDVGRGLQGNYFDFTLLNQDGCDFDLEGIHFEPIILKRKI